LDDNIKPGQELTLEAIHPNGTKKVLKVISRLDSIIEIDYYRHGGILQYMLRRFLNEA